VRAAVTRVALLLFTAAGWLVLVAVIAALDHAGRSQ